MKGRLSLSNVFESRCHHRYVGNVSKPPRDPDDTTLCCEVNFQPGGLAYYGKPPSVTCPRECMEGGQLLCLLNI